jgi:hypothetical protein
MTPAHPKEDCPYCLGLLWNDRHDGITRCHTDGCKGQEGFGKWTTCGHCEPPPGVPCECSGYGS